MNKIVKLSIFSLVIFFYASSCHHVFLAETISAPNEIAILTARVNTLENLNERILNSVYWTLGILATIFLGLISVNLFINIKANKREIENIKTDFAQSSKNNILASETRILKETSTQIQKEIKTIKTEILSIARNEITTSENEILEKVSALNSKEFDGLRVEILNIVKNETLGSESKMMEKINGLDKIKTAEIEKINRSFVRVNDKISDLEISVKEFEIDRFAAKGQQGQIIGLIDLLEISIDKDRYDVVDRLLKVRDYLKDNSIRSYVASKLNTEITKIENNPKYKNIAEEVRALTKIFVD